MCSTTWRDGIRKKGKGFPKSLHLTHIFKQKKKRTHDIKSTGEDGESKNPKTFVIERGKVGSTLKQLVLDFRRVMEPYTATHLKVKSGSENLSTPCHCFI